MVSALRTDNFPPWLQSAIFWLEDQIWREGSETDTRTPAFYVYKSFPSSLKKNQIQDWAALQKRVLSPFSGGDSYMYIGKAGVAFWASPTSFAGIPETAVQAPLNDGEYLVKGESLTYLQRWKDRNLVECVVADTDEQGNSLAIDTSSRRAWAKTHPLSDAFTKPGVWAVILGVLTLLMLVWYGAGAATLWQQNSQLEEHATQIEASLGNKLAVQSEFQQSQGLLEGVYAWQNHYAHLPQALSIVIEAVLGQSVWRADVVEWQNNRLRIELVSSELDISALVAALENTDAFGQVSIRPHTNANTWNLEVIVNELAIN